MAHAGTPEKVDHADECPDRQQIPSGRVEASEVRCRSETVAATGLHSADTKPLYRGHGTSRELCEVIRCQ
jgi:hypothetical protein